MKNDFVYSSEFACDNITRRELRAMEDVVTEVHAGKFAHELLLPIGERITTSGRLKRGTIKPMVDRVEQILRNSRGIIDVEVDSLAHSKLSPNENFRFAFFAGMNEGEHWLEFLLNEARITRKEFLVHTTKADFRIHRHAISRFMQREHKPVREMYPLLAHALRASTLLAEAAVLIPGAQIAIAVGNGLLLGRVREIKWAQHPMYIERFCVRPKVLEHEMVDRPDREDGGSRFLVEMMTYVDSHSLVPARAALRDRLEDFQRRNADVLKMMFDATYFFTATVPQYLAREAETMSSATISEAHDIVHSPEWQQFAATAR